MEDCAELIPGCNLQKVHGKTELHRFLDVFFRKNVAKDVCVTGYYLRKMLRDFTLNFKPVEAAGGLVSNVENRFLFIKRFDIWDLPKGKVEQGEHSREAAVREVEEETGITGLKIVKELPSTYHIYSYKDKLMLKKTLWYRMTTELKRELKPQLKESITDAVWLNLTQSKKALVESYRSLYETLSPFLEENS